MYDTLIDLETLKKHYQKQSWLLVDSRYDLTDAQAGVLAYQTSHIPGAVYVDLHEDLSSVDAGVGGGRHPLPTEKQLNQLFSRLGISADTQVIVYDSASGAVAARFWWMLRYMGHDAVAVLDGGWQSWEEQGYEIERESTIPEAVSFAGKARRDWLLTLPEVARAALLLDSRDPARYRGEIEPMDPVAGHIPGAKNHFFQRNLDEKGRFLDAERLKQQFLASYCDIEAGQVVFYCGSGVTACHNILSATYAGLPMPKLYAGSWSEWCADSDRPVAVGQE